MKQVKITMDKQETVGLPQEMSDLLADCSELVQDLSPEDESAIAGGHNKHRRGKKRRKGRGDDDDGGKGRRGDDDDGGKGRRGDDDDDSGYH